MTWTLHQGDCREVIKDIPDNSIDSVITDPPYKTITGGDTNPEKYQRPKGMLGGNRKLFEYQNNIKISEWMPEIYRVLKDNSHCYIFTNVLNLKEMLLESEKAGFKLHNLLVWEKNNCTPSQFYMKNCEYILFLRKGKAKFINNIGESKTVHQINNITGEKLHPTEKPIHLLMMYIKNSSNFGDTILDPFCGSGSMLEAAELTGRNSIGIEIDEIHCTTTNQRMANIEPSLFEGVTI